MKALTLAAFALAACLPELASGQVAASARLSQSTIGLGSATRYTVTLTNGGGALSGVGVEVALPSGLHWAGSGNIGNLCYGYASVSADASTLRLTGARLGAGRSCTLAANLISDAPGAYVVATGVPTGGPDGATAGDASLTVTTSQFGLSLDVDRTALTVGESTAFTYRLDLTGVSDTPFFQLNNALVLPSGLAIVGTPVASGSCSASLFTSSTSGFSVTLTSSGPVECQVSGVLRAMAAGLHTLSITPTGFITSGTLSSGFAYAEIAVDGSRFHKQFSGDPVAGGGSVTLTYTLTNTRRDAAAAGLAFTDDLSAVAGGLTALSLPAEPCGAGSTLTGEGLLTFAGGSLAKGATCSFSVELQVPEGAAGGSYTSISSTLTGTVGGAPFTAAAAGSEVTVLEGPLVSVALSPSVATGDDTLVATFTVKNPYADDLTAIGFAAALGSALPNVALGSLPIAPCNGGSLSLANSGVDDRALYVSGLTLASGTGCSFDVPLILPSSVPDGRYTLTASSVVASRNDVSVSGTGGSGTVDLRSAGRLTVSPSATRVGAGDSLDLVFAVSLRDDAAAQVTGLGFSLDLDAALAGLQATAFADNGLCGSAHTVSGTSTVTVNQLDLTPGAEPCEITVTVSVPANGSGAVALTTSALTGAIGGDPVISAAASTSFTVSSGLGLAVAVSLNQDAPAYRGQTVALDLTFTNAGSQVLSSVTYEGDLTHFGGTFSSSDAGCGSTSTQLNGNRGFKGTTSSLLPGASCTQRLQVSLSLVGQVQLRLSGNAITSGATESYRVTPTFAVGASPLSVVAAFSNVEVAPGGATTLNVLLHNEDQSAVSSAGFTVDLEAAFGPGVVASVSSASEPCGAGSSLTVQDGVLTLTGGLLAGGADCTLSADISVPADVGLSVVTATTSTVTGVLSGTAVTASAASATLIITPLEADRLAAGPVTAGDPLTVTWAIHNPGATPVAGISFIDSLAPTLAGLKAAELVSISGCGGLAQLSLGDSLRLTGATVAGGATCIVVARLPVPELTLPGSYSLGALSVLASAGTPSVTVAPTSFEVLQSVPGFSAVLTPARQWAGQAITLTLTVDNTHSVVAATGLTLNGVIPDGTVVADPPNVATTCAGATFSASAGDSNLVWTGAAVGAQSSCTLSVDVTGSSVGAVSATLGPLTTNAGDAPAVAVSAVFEPLPTVGVAVQPSRVGVTQVTRVTLTVDNTHSALDAAALHAAVNLPEGLRVADPVAVESTCGGTVSADAGASTVSLDGGALAGAGTCSVSVDVQAVSAGLYIVATDAPTSSAGQSASAEATLRVDPPPTLAVAFSAPVVGATQVSTLTLTVDQSSSTLDATGAAFVLTLPEGLVVSTPPTIVNTCGFDVSALTAGASQAALTGGTLPAAGACVLSVTVASAAAGQYVVALEGFSSSFGPSQAVSTQLSVQPAPAVTLALEPSTVGATSAATLVVAVDHGASSLPVAGVALDVPLPSGVLAVAGAQPVTDCNGTVAFDGGVLSLSGAALDAGERCTFRLEVAAAAPGLYAFQSEALSSDFGPSPHGIATLSVQPAPVTAVSAEPSVALATKTVRVTLSFDNDASEVAVSALAATATLPDGVVAVGEVQSTCGGTVTFADPASSAVLAGGGLTAGGACTVAFDVVSPTALTGTVTLTGVTSTSGPSAEASTSLTFQGPPGFSLSVDPDRIGATNAALLTLTLDNSAGELAVGDLATGVTLPEGLQLEAAPETTCGGTVSGQTEGLRVELTGATLPAGEKCTITASVLGVVPGAYTLTSDPLASAAGPQPALSAGLAVEPPPVLTLALQPAQVRPLAPAIVRLRVDNGASQLAVHAVSTRVNVPEGLTVDLESLSHDCPTAEVTLDGQGLVLADGALAAGASCTLSFAVLGAAIGFYDLTTDALSSAFGVSASASATLAVADAPAQSVTLTPDTVFVGGPTQLVLTLDATGVGVDATGIQTLVTLPASLSASELATTCGQGTVSVVGNQLRLVGGTLAVDATCTVSARLVASTVGVLVVDVTPLESSNGPSAGASASLLVEPEPTMGLSVASAVLLGGSTPVTLTVTNHSAVLGVDGIGVSVSVPAALSVLDAAEVTNTCGGKLVVEAQQVGLNSGVLAPGASCTLTFRVRGQALGAATLSTTTLTSSAGTLPAVSASLEVLRTPTLSAAFAPAAIVQGASARFTLTVANPESSVVEGAVITVDLPSGLAADQPNGDCGGTLNLGPNALRVTGAVLPAGATCQVSLRILPGRVGDLTLDGHLAAAAGLDATTSATLIVTAPETPAAPRLTLTPQPASISSSEQSRVVLTIDNSASSADATDVSGTITIPNGLVVLSDPAAASDCGTAVVSIAAGRLYASGGSVAAGASCTVTVTLIGRAEGEYTLEATGRSSLGASRSVAATLTVTDSAVVEPVTRTDDSSSSGCQSGAGASPSAAWLLGMCVLALWRRPRRSAR